MAPCLLARSTDLTFFKKPLTDLVISVTRFPPLHKILRPRRLHLFNILYCFLKPHSARSLLYACIYTEKGFMDKPTTNFMDITKNAPQRFLLNTLFAVVLIIIFTINIVTFLQIDKFTSANQWVIHSYKVINTTNNILLEILNAESETRGFIITNEEHFISTVDQTINKAMENFTLAKTLTQDNPKQLELFKDLEPLLKARINILNKSIQFAKSKIINTPKGIDIINQAQTISGNIKDIIREIILIEVNLLERREETVSASLDLVLTLTSVTNIINIILLTIGVVLFNRLLTTAVKSQKELESSETLLKAIIGGINDFIAALDLNYNFIALNLTFAEEFKKIYGKRVTIGMNLKDLCASMPTDEQQNLLSIWERALAGDEYSLINAYGLENLQRNYYEISFSSLVDDTKEIIGAILIGRNVTKRLQQETSLKTDSTTLKQAFHKLEESANEMTLLNEMDVALATSTSLKEILHIIAIYLKRLLPQTAGILYLMKASRNYLEEVTTWNNPSIQVNVIQPNQCIGLRQGKMYHFSDPEEMIACKHTEHKDNNIPPYFCVPLLGQNEVLGLIYMELRQSLEMTSEEIKDFAAVHQMLILNVAGQIALSISNRKLYDALEIRSTKDPLTNLFNRAYLNETLDRDLERARRKSSTLAFIMIDLDFFKNVNDKYGHDAGDVVLKTVGQLLIQQTRKGDIACRYGGEEFLLVFYDSKLEDALERTEQLRQLISDIPYMFNRTSQQITASIGISLYPNHGEDLETLISAADKALYLSKKNGRNQVTVYQMSANP